MRANEYLVSNFAFQSKWVCRYAEAEKIMVVKAAEADAEAKYLAGTGIARQRQAIINGGGGVHVASS
jgi:hypothetical protein